MLNLDGYDCILMFLAALLVTLVTAMVVLDDATTMITECQKDLPRSQKCKLIAVPEER